MALSTNRKRNANTSAQKNPYDDRIIPWSTWPPLLFVCGAGCSCPAEAAFEILYKHLGAGVSAEAEERVYSWSKPQHFNPWESHEISWGKVKCLFLHQYTCNFYVTLTGLQWTAQIWLYQSVNLEDYSDRQYDIGSLHFTVIGIVSNETYREFSVATFCLWN